MIYAFTLILLAVLILLIVMICRYEIEAQEHDTHDREIFEKGEKKGYANGFRDGANSQESLNDAAMAALIAIGRTSKKAQIEYEAAHKPENSGVYADGTTDTGWGGHGGLNPGAQVYPIARLRSVPAPTNSTPAA